MSLSFQNSFVHKINSVLPLAQNSSGLAVRVASLASDVLGTLTAVGAASTPTWTLTNAPSWVALSASGNVCTLNFSGAQYQQDPYEFFVTCTDKVTTIYYPVFLEVRAPFFIAADTTNTMNVVNGSTLTIDSYDNSVVDINILGYGLFNTTQSGVRFVLPPSMPAGLSFVTSDESKLVLRVQEATESDLVGGLELYAGAPTAVSIPLQAYQPNSFYDTPDRSYTLNLAVSSQKQKAGLLDFGLGAQFDTASSYLRVDADVAVLNGILQSSGVAVATPYQLVWSYSGPLFLGTGGNLNGAFNNTFAAYSVLSSGPATVTLTLNDANGNAIANGSKTITFPAVSQSTSPWLSGAVKVHLSEAVQGGVAEANIIKGYAGSIVPVTVSVPATDINPDDSFIFAIGVAAQSSCSPSLEVTATTNISTVTISATQLQSVVNFTIPATAAIGTKWALTASTNDTVRMGTAQTIIECLGKPPLTVTVPNTTINAATGTTTVVQVLAQYGTNSIPGATFELIGAPDGVYINSSGQLYCGALFAGTYLFTIAATVPGYARSYSGEVTLVVAYAASPLSISNPTSTASSIQDNMPFTLSWGTTGNSTGLYLAQYPSITPVRAVTGSNSVNVQQVGSTIYTIYGTNFYGWAYSVPFVCLSSSVQTLAQLLPSPTIAVIDESNRLTANWTPYQVDGAYSVYKGWNITLTTGGVSNTTFTTGGNLASASFTVLTGDYTMDMVALSNDYSIALDSPSWDAPHKFPSTLQDASVAFNTANGSSSLFLGQPLNITLVESYTDADSWRVDFPDNTSTGWIPLSTRFIPKVFTSSVSQDPTQTGATVDIVITTQRDYSTNNPAVKLRRLVTKSLYVSNQQYATQASAEATLTSTLGIVGTQGFEVVSTSTTSVPTEPYEVIVRALARDTVTNELKLMLATSRYSNASSLLGTMAIDVFPIQGRPHVKELLRPTLALSATAASSLVPVTIQTTTLPSNCYIGKAMQTAFNMVANGGTPSYKWYADNLPPGLNMNIDGTISGAPTLLGSFDVTFAAVDSSVPAYIAETTLPFVISSDLVITTPSLSQMQVGTPYTQQLTNTGGLLPYTWSVVGGSLPIGMTVNKDTGEVSGTPCSYNSTLDFTSPYSVTIQVEDAVGGIAAKTFSVGLVPASLGFGVVDQTEVIAEEDFKLVVPVTGGQSPYTLTGFVDSGIIGSGLQVVNPSQVSVLSGVTPTGLRFNTGDQTFFPQSYPSYVSVVLSATGGVPWNSSVPTAQSYKFFVDNSAVNTLPGAVCYGALLVATPTADGTFTVTVKVIDSVGHIASKTLNVKVQQLNSGVYTLAPFIINDNGNGSNPNNWTFTAIPALPDAQVGVSYTPAANQFYALVLMKSGQRVLSLPNAPMINVIQGAVPTDIYYSPGNAANCVLFFNGTQSRTATDSFEIQMSGMDGTVAFTTAARQSITTTANGGGTTPVIVVAQTAEMDVDLSMLSMGSVAGVYGWAYPLIIEGGVAPYTPSPLGSTTLPGVSLIAVNNLPVLTSNTTNVGSYQVGIKVVDSAGTVTQAVIPVQVINTSTQPTHILATDTPAYLYMSRPVANNTYYLDADQISSWSATGLPPGVTLSSMVGTRAYLAGTPTVVGQNTVVITATSVVYGTSAEMTVQLEVRAQQALIQASLTTPVVGKQYRVVNGSSFLSVNYIGYQPGDANLPMLTSQLAQLQPPQASLGAPNISSAGQPTTGNTNVTPDGFTMNFDYTASAQVNDTVTLSQNGQNVGSITLTNRYSTLTAVAQNIVQGVSEYSVTAILPLPVLISGGQLPYSVVVPVTNTVVGVSDTRFIPVDGTGTPVAPNTPCTGLQITSGAFATGGSYPCAVSMVVSDSSGQSVNVAGTVTVNITLGTIIQVAFEDADWSISLGATEPNIGSFVPSLSKTATSPLLNIAGLVAGGMSTALLGHAPYTYDVTSMTIPIGLAGFIHESPTGRVLAFNLNETNTSASVVDVDNTLTSTPITGSFAVAASTLSSAPTANTYVITVGLKVTDSLGITASATQNINVKIS